MQLADPRTPGPVGDDAAWAAVSAFIYVPAAVASIGWVAWRSGSTVVWSRQVGTDPLLWTIVGLTLGVVLALLSQWLAPRSAQVAALRDSLAGQIGPLSPGTTLLLALLSSVGEEWVFRGVLQPAWGWPAATVVFALVHIPIERALWVWPIMALAVGLLLAALFELSGGLLAPIGLHFAVNALNLRWLARHARAAA